MSKECNVSESSREDLNLVAVRLSPHGDYKPDPVVDLVHNPKGLPPLPPLQCCLACLPGSYGRLKYLRRVRNEKGVGIPKRKRGQKEGVLTLAFGPGIPTRMF